MIRILITLLLLAPLGAKAAEETYGSVTISEVTSIYDADTFRANIPGWPSVVGKRISIRVNGVDAPEIRGKCAREKAGARAAKQHTVAMLRGARSIELRNIRRGKYFRLLADVYTDGKNLAQSLIQAGLARPYHGGRRKGWCD
jgi:micrococcal nuclease